MRWLHDPRAPRWTLILALLLGLLALPAGLAIDDHVLRMHLAGEWLFPEAHPILTLFHFVPADPAQRRAMLELGLLPWWSHPELHLAFFRPLTALTHALDFALWPEASWLAHLHSALWWVFAAAAVGALLRRLHGPGAVAALGLLLFVVEDAHAWPIWWISNRNALVALGCGALAASAHLDWRRGGGARALLASQLLLALGLLGGESGVGALAWIAAAALTLEPGPLPRRLASLGPSALTVILWRLVWAWSGCAATGSGLYIDPLGDPGRFLRGLAERLPTLALGQWTQMPIDIAAFAPPALSQGMALGGLLVLLALGVWLGPLLRERPEARFHALAFLLALIPVSATFVMARLLSFASVSALALLAMQAERAGLLAPPGAPRAEGRPLGTLALLALHGPLALLLLVLQIVGLPLGAAAMQRDGARQIARAEPTDLLVVVNSDSLLTIYLLLHPEIERPPARLALLAPAGGPVEARRTDARTLELRVADGWLWAPKDQLMRDPGLPFAVGERVALPDYTAEILRVTPDGQPETVRFTFARSLDEPGTLVVGFDGRGLAPLDLPLGEARTLPGLVL